MLAETRMALRITTTAYDAELAALILAAVNDMSIAGVRAEGVNIAVSWNNGAATVTDTSTITDEALKRALITYVRCHFGSPDDYDRLKAAYDEQKAQFVTSSAYALNYWSEE